MTQRPISREDRHAYEFVLVGAGVVLIASMPWIADNYAVRVATTLCLFVTMGLSWNFIGGYAGYPSFATAAFFGFGAYAGAILQTKGVPMLAAWMAATILTAAFSALLGFAILRLRGHYFAVGSFAVLELVKLAASTWTGLTGGGTGLNVPIMPGRPRACCTRLPLCHAGTRGHHIRSGGAGRPLASRLRAQVHPPKRERR